MEGLAVVEKAGVAEFILGKRYSFHKSVQREYTSMRWCSLGKSILEGGTQTRIGVRGNQGATYVVETPKDAQRCLLGSPELHPPDHDIHVYSFVSMSSGGG
jgi:hypothetical protein